MIKIYITKTEYGYLLSCKPVGNEDFIIKINQNGELIEKPEGHDMEGSLAYFKVKHMLNRGEPLPDRTVAAWG